MSHSGLPAELLQPPGLLGQEPDMQPWSVLCSDHGVQVGRLTCDEQFGVASNRGLCEACLVSYYLRCSKHGVQLKTIDSGCLACYSESISQSGPAVGEGAAAESASRTDVVGNLPNPGPVAGQGVLAAQVRRGPPAFGGLSDGDGGWVRPREVPGGAGDGTGGDSARIHPTEESGPPTLGEGAVLSMRPAGAQPEELPIVRKFRTLAASRLLLSLSSQTTQTEESEGLE